MIEHTLHNLFHSIFPKELFNLSFSNGLSDIQTINRKIRVKSTENLFMVTHEMAHVIETPNARIFNRDFGLSFTTYKIKNTRFEPEYVFKTKVHLAHSFNCGNTLLLIASGPTVETVG